VKWRPVIIAALTCAALAVIVVWVIHSRQAGSWLNAMGFRYLTGCG
jgi:hypothetical protein